VLLKEVQKSGGEAVGPARHKLPTRMLKFADQWHASTGEVEMFSLPAT
jgi:hypothetical protein